MRRLYSGSSRALLTLILTTGYHALHAEAEPFYVARTESRDPSLHVRETLLEIWINGRPTGDTVLLIQKGGRLFADTFDLKRWRLQPAETPFFPYRGHNYFPLDAIDGLGYRIEPDEMKLLIHADSRAFAPSRIDVYANGINSAASAAGGFFNYDLFWQGGESRSEFNGLGEMGIFGGGGLLLGNFAYRNGPDGSKLVRLETSYRKDWPKALKTVKLGDAISRSGSLWGNSVRFGGVQWGTNFQIRPGLITTPLLNLGGEAALPSTVDLYINDSLRMHEEVPPGPFMIDQIPLVSGLGEATLVVTDILGREQVISDAFYASQKLLRAGLGDYSIEAGFLRKNFAIRSNDYGRLMTSGTYRRGITDAFTAELHGEFTDRTQTAGMSGAWRWDRIGIFSAAAAASSHEGDAGALGVAGFEHSGGRFSFGGLFKSATEAFAQIGTSAVPPRAEEYVYTGYSVPNFGAINASFTHRDYRNRDDIALLGIGYQNSWRNIGSLGISFRRTVVSDTETAVTVYWTRSFGERRTGSAGYTEDSSGSRETVRFKKNLPTGPGYGYALAADFGKYDRLEALYEWQGNYGTYGAWASHTDYSDTFRASARGGVAMMEGEWFLSRRIDQSFAVVDTGAFSGIGILKDNLPVGKTNANGKLLVPNLRAYEKNPIRIEEADLPLEATLPYLSQEAVPAYRSGALVSFPLQKTRRALLSIVLENGIPPPPGASVQIEGKEERFPVGRDGTVYLEGLSERSRIRVSWNGSACEFTVDYPKTDDPMPTLGEFTCKGVRQ